MSDQPLFQDADERERELAPEQVPGTPEHERQQQQQHTPPPLVPARGDTSQNQPIPLPAQAEPLDDDNQPADNAE